MDQVFGPEVGSVLTRSLRKDSSLLFSRTEERKKAIGCLEAMTEVGVLENTTMGCFAAKTIMLTTLICICMVVGIKFVMALTFSWFLSYRLTEKPRKVLKASTKDKEAMSNSAQDLARGGKKSVGRRNLFTAMLVTCYSEGENSIRTTLDSLANTSYSSRHKLLASSTTCFPERRWSTRPSSRTPLDRTRLDSGMHSQHGPGFEGGAPCLLIEKGVGGEGNITKKKKLGIKTRKADIL